MKRYSHPIGDSSHTLWDAICSMDNLKLAHQNAKKGKGWYKEVKMVDENPDYYLGLLQEMLVNHTYKTSEYQTFYKTDSNKKRLIFKLPYFPDRICQWAVLQVIEPIISKNSPLTPILLYLTGAFTNALQNFKMLCKTMRKGRSIV